MKAHLLLVLSLAGVQLAGLAALSQMSPTTAPSPTATPASSLKHVIPAAEGAGSEDESAADLPVVKLEFKLQDPISGAQGSSAFLTPIVCSPDGVPFVSFIDPKSFGPQTIESLDPKGGHEFSAKAISDLYGIDFFRSYFVSDTMVGVLVHATTDDKKAANTIPMGPGLQPRAVYTGGHHDYLVEFDSNGGYRKAVELPGRYQFRSLAALPDDNLLALGFDRANSVPQLLVLGSDGQVARTLQIPSEMQDSRALVEGQAGGTVERAKAESSLSSWIFASVRHKVLLYQVNASVPVVEVGAGGAVREVHVQFPRGYALDSVIPADDRWLMRFRRQNLSDSGAIDASPEAGNYVLYEVNPSDGSLRRRVEMATGPFYSVACEQGGVIKAFSVEDGKVRLETAELPR